MMNNYYELWITCIILVTLNAAAVAVPMALLQIYVQILIMPIFEKAKLDKTN